MATHSEIKDMAIRSQDRDIEFLKQQLAQARKQIEDFRAYEEGYGDKFDSFCDAMHKQALMDAKEIAEAESLEDPDPKDDGDRAYQEAIKCVAEALRREADK